MTTNEQPTPAPDADPSSAPTEETALAGNYIHLFTIPALVVAACVGVFLFFGWMVSEEKSSVEYLQEIRTGGVNRRWQAAFELSKFLNHQPEQAKEEGLVPEMVAVFQSAESDDPRVRRYLALALGHLGDPEAVPVLLDGIEDEDPETRIYSIWSLGRIGDARAVEPLLVLARNDDPGIRKMAVYGLGMLREQKAVPVLQAALDDSTFDVAWNAAIALAQLGDDSGRGRILQMLDREFLDSLSEMTEEQRAEAMVAAIKGAMLLGGEDLHHRLEEISEDDPNLKVRQAAFEALAEMD